MPSLRGGGSVTLSTLQQIGKPARECEEDGWGDPRGGHLRESWGHIHASLLNVQLVNLLLAGLHNVRQLGVARHVQAQVGGEHCWQRHGQSLRATVHLPRHCDVL